MDKNEVLRILTDLDDTGPIAEVHFDMSELRERADAIAQAAEEEMGQIKAQVAVMRQPIEHYLRIMKDRSGKAMYDEWLRVDDEMEKGLSAAPKVAARLKMRLWREPMGDRYLVSTGQESYLAMGKLRYDRAYDVLVLATEQGQESE